LINDFSHKRIEFRFAPGGDDNLGARARKHLCCSPPDPRARARHDRYLTLEITHHDTPPHISDVDEKLHAIELRANAESCHDTIDGQTNVIEPFVLSNSDCRLRNASSGVKA